MKDLSIVIVTYNSQYVILDCLKSIVEQTTVDYEILVVDNASQDDSCRHIQDQFSQVHLIRNTKNLGFAAACNIAIERSEGRYVMLLNPDTKVLRGALDKMVAFLDNHPAYGMVGPELIELDGSVNFTGGRRFSDRWWEILARQVGEPLHMPFDDRHLMKEWDHLASREVEAISGACMMVRREAINRAGMLDPHFFFMVEDVEWCRRLRQAGWPAYYLAEAQVVHTFGHSYSERPMGKIIFVESAIGSHYYLKKYYGPAQAGIYRVLISLFGISYLLIGGFKSLTQQRTPQWGSRIWLVKLLLLWQSPFRIENERVG